MNRIIALLKCPDQVGIVGKITGLLYQSKINIISLEEHVEENGLLFMRIVGDLEGAEKTREEISGQLQQEAENLQGTLVIRDQGYRPKVAILVTRENACLYELVLGQKSGVLPCDIPVVISNHDTLKPEVSSFDIPFEHVPVEKGKKGEAEQTIFNILEKHSIDLVVLARYMQIVSEDFVTRYEDRIINIHHGFLPAFKGANPYRQAWDKGVKIIGATSHYVTSNLDEGPIISQDIIPVTHQDRVEDMKQKGRDIERRVLFKAVKAHIENRVIVHGPRTIVFER